MNMFRKLTAILLLLLLPAAALAEVYEGSTTALSTVTVQAGVAGVLESLDAQAGDRVEAGQALARVMSEKVFATQDGTVALIYAGEGETADGAVLELLPLERYQIYCTVDKAYQSAEATLAHSGETVYIRCTADGSHRAVGIVTTIDGTEYRVLTLGGELYVGETVYIYRDEDFTSAQRLGMGTVVSNDAQIYEAEGTISSLRVVEGDYVERGQLLYKVGGNSVSIPVSGILTDVSAQPGDSVSENQVLAEIAPEDQIRVEIQVSEGDAAKMKIGRRVGLLFAADSHETPRSGTVESVAWIASENLYAVRILPEDTTGLVLGMSATVKV